MSTPTRWLYGALAIGAGAWIAVSGIQQRDYARLALPLLVLAVAASRRVLRNLPAAQYVPAILLAGAFGLTALFALYTSIHELLTPRLHHDEIALASFGGFAVLGCLTALITVGLLRMRKGLSPDVRPQMPPPGD